MIVADDVKKPDSIDLSKHKWLAMPIATVLGFAVLSAGLVLGPRYLPSVDPTPGPPLPPAPVVVEQTKFDYDTTVVLQDGKVLAKAKAKPIIDAVNNGNATYTVRGFVEGKSEETRTVAISGGVVPVPPIPVPPEPPKPPVPPEPPQPTGPLTVLLIRESGDSTPEMAMLIRDLRTGPVAEYLKSKMHALGVLDPQAKDADGKPSPVVEEWRPHFSGITLPALIVYDPTTKKVLAKQPVTAATTATQIMDKVKEVGG